MAQPRPFDPTCQRRAPTRSFPPYRHLPGETPHPRTHLRGHAYGAEAGYDGLPLRPDNWHCNEAYLFGVDLYNYAYWWEAHEQWEGLWRLAGSQSVCGLYLRGLIQISAVLIKWHQGNQRGTAGLSGRGRDRLEQVLTGGKREVYMGLDLRDFLRRVDGFLAHFPGPGAMDAVYEDPGLAPLIHLETACTQPRTCCTTAS